MSTSNAITRSDLETLKAMGDTLPRTWLITGSSRGLGRALAEAAFAAGENVVATARNPDQLRDLVKRYPSNARAVRLDVTDREQAAAAVQATTDAFGRLDVLVEQRGGAVVGCRGEPAGRHRR